MTLSHNFSVRSWLEATIFGATKRTLASLCFPLNSTILPCFLPNPQFLILFPHQTRGPLTHQTHKFFSFDILVISFLYSSYILPHLDHLFYFSPIFVLSILLLPIHPITYLNLFCSNILSRCCPFQTDLLDCVFFFFLSVRLFIYSWSLLYFFLNFLFNKKN